MANERDPGARVAASRARKWKETVVPVSLGSLAAVLATVLSYGQADGKKTEKMEALGVRISIVEIEQKSDRVFLHSLDKRLAVIGDRVGARGAMKRITQEQEDELKEIQ